MIGNTIWRGIVLTLFSISKIYKLILLGILSAISLHIIFISILGIISTENITYKYLIYLVKRWLLQNERTILLKYSLEQLENAKLLLIILVIFLIILFILLIIRKRYLYINYVKGSPLDLHYIEKVFVYIWSLSVGFFICLSIWIKIDNGEVLLKGFLRYYLLLIYVSSLLGIIFLCISRIVSVWTTNMLFLSGIPIDEELYSKSQLDDIKSKIGNRHIFNNINRGLEFLENILSKLRNFELARKSYTIVIDGKWGAGKTSLIRVFQDISTDRSILWVRFNPNYFTNHTELIEEFFNTLDAKISERYGTGLGYSLYEYLRLITPALEDVNGIRSITKFINNIFFKKQTITKLRENIASKLQDINEKIIIVIDDIDRMEPKDIIILLRLIRFLSDFPSTVFILPMHYQHVSTIVQRQLGESEYKNFLQKIINARYFLESYTYQDMFAIYKYYLTSYDAVKYKPTEKEYLDVFEKLMMQSLSKQVREYLNIHRAKKIEVNNYNAALFETEYLFYKDYYEIINIDRKQSFYSYYKELHLILYPVLLNFIIDIAENKHKTFDNFNFDLYKIANYIWKLRAVHDTIDSYQEKIFYELANFVNKVKEVDSAELAVLNNGVSEIINRVILNFESRQQDITELTNLFYYPAKFKTYILRRINSGFEEGFGNVKHSIDRVLHEKNIYRDEEIREFLNTLSMSLTKDIITIIEGKDKHKQKDRENDQIKSIIIQRLFTARDIKHFDQYLISSSDDLSIFKNSVQYNELVSQFVEQITLPEL
ncbi:MAG: hypothetical protein KA998_02845 [Rickettsiaceae bacterium]|nr:hypothetical protein [Rickettsiaceae bacterium]